MLKKQRMLILSIAFFLLGCSATQVTMLKDQEGEIFPNKIPFGSLRVMQVMNIEKTSILKDPARYEQFMHSAFGFISPYWNALEESRALYNELLSTGKPESEINEGYLVLGRVYCCGGVQETVVRQYAFSLSSLKIQRNDFVEVRFGHGKPGEINTVTRVVYGCGWVPNDPRLWVRIPYCTWMKDEGWIEKMSLITASNHAWLKPQKK